MQWFQIVLQSQTLLTSFFYCFGNWVLYCSSVILDCFAITKHSTILTSVISPTSYINSILVLDFFPITNKVLFYTIFILFCQSPTLFCTNLGLFCYHNFFYIIFYGSMKILHCCALILDCFAITIFSTLSSMVLWKSYIVVHWF